MLAGPGTLLQPRGFANLTMPCDVFGSTALRRPGSWWRCQEQPFTAQCSRAAGRRDRACRAGPAGAAGIGSRARAPADAPRSPARCPWGDARHQRRASFRGDPVHAADRNGGRPLNEQGCELRPGAAAGRRQGTYPVTCCCGSWPISCRRQCVAISIPSPGATSTRSPRRR